MTPGGEVEDDLDVDGLVDEQEISVRHIVSPGIV